ncbi:MAG: ATP-binding cassette domain-containing protein [Steroidobacteraceae bacterium]
MDLKIERASTTAIVGPSGSGKSTLLKLAIGLLWPSRGHVRINGEVLSTDNALALRQRIGYVIQTGGLFPHVSARDNVGLMARHLKRSASEIDARINELAELVQLDRTMLERQPQALSGGQRQRVSLMRALMLDPPLLLLDEPLGALDPMVRYELQNDLRRLFAQLGKTVVLVTHDLAEASFFADRVVLLRDGHIVQQGRYEDLAQAPADPFVTEFLRAQRRLHEPT